MTTVKEAVAARFQEIMKERGIKTNELANRSGVTPSSVYSMLDPRRKEVSVNLVKKLCDGLDMTLGEFFSAPVFDKLEQEIQQKLCGAASVRFETIAIYSSLTLVWFIIFHMFSTKERKEQQGGSGIFCVRQNLSFII